MATKLRDKKKLPNADVILIDNITSWKCQQTTNNFIISLKRKFRKKIARRLCYSIWRLLSPLFPFCPLRSRFFLSRLRNNCRKNLLFDELIFRTFSEEEKTNKQARNWDHRVLYVEQSEILFRTSEDIFFCVNQAIFIHSLFTPQDLLWSILKEASLLIENR